MTIKREDVDRRIVDFSDVASGRRLPLSTPATELEARVGRSAVSLEPCDSARAVRRCIPSLGAPG
jgi:hypothetical protein